MNDQWIHEQRRNAGVDPGEDPAPYLKRIELWQERAQEVADNCTHNELKTAVCEVPPTDDEAQALYELYALWAESIYAITMHTHQSHAQNGAADEPVASPHDLIQESYVLFQRAMVRSTTKEKMTSRLRARMAEHVRTQLTVEDDPDNRHAVEDREAIAPGYNLPQLYDELHDEGRLSRRAEKLWERLHPEGG